MRQPIMPNDSAPSLRMEDGKCAVTAKRDTMVQSTSSSGTAVPTSAWRVAINWPLLIRYVRLK